MVALLVGAAPLAQTPEPAQDDFTEAVRTRANAGDASAQFNLGLMYDIGEGVPENDGNAVAWYLKAAEQGFAVAQSNLGLMYRTGLGVPQDDVEAVTWYRKAAEQRFAVAQFNFGLMCANGRGVPQDDVEAYKWFNLAATYADAEQREEFADERDRAAERLTPEQRAEGQKLAREWFAAHPPE